MFSEYEPITASYEELRSDPEFKAIWGTPRYPPSDLSRAVAGLRTMPECDERNTLAETVWWDIADKAGVSRAVIAAVKALRPPLSWTPPPYTLAQHRGIRRKLEQWGWHFSRGSEEA